jgi:cation diffusion facilitator family transporter
MDYETRYLQARHITLLGAFINLLLAMIKIVAGLWGRSHALFADGVHSLSDLLSDALVLLASRYGSRDADSDHPYGHARIETAATVVVAALMLLAGGGIVYDAGVHLYEHHVIPRPDFYVFWVAIFSVIANEVIYRFTRRIADRIQSELLRAHALHWRSDAASSLVVLLGIGLALLGIHTLDVVAAIIVGVMIVKMGAEFGWEGVRELIDTGLDEATLAQIHDIIKDVAGVRMVHQLRTRTMGRNILVDVHILVDPYLSVSDGHYIGHQVHLTLMEKIPAIIDVTVHVDAEDDEIVSPTSKLPPRDVFLDTVRECWRTLPGGDNIQMITTHYLGGKIRVEVGLPLEFAQNRNAADQLKRSYQEAVSHLNEIDSIQLWFD